jgi:hypothetical protein
MTCLEAEEEYYEAEMAKSKIDLNLPIQLGMFILNYAKLRMLDFHYNFVDKCIDRSDYQLCEMDTDSSYMCISEENIEDAVKPEMKAYYQNQLTGFCRDDAPNDRWLPRTCCEKHIKYDKRLPGLFKTEYTGDEMISLCSKSYVVRSDNGVKFSAKGINKRNVEDPFNVFRRVLETQKAESGTIKGFRVKDNGISTYIQERKGFSYFYCKRIVLDDGINTVPLQIPLRPRQTEYQ